MRSRSLSDAMRRSPLSAGLGSRRLSRRAWSAAGSLGEIQQILVVELQLARPQKFEYGSMYKCRFDTLLSDSSNHIGDALGALTLEDS